MKVLAPFTFAIVAAGLILAAPRPGLAQHVMMQASGHMSPAFAHALANYRLNEDVLKGLNVLKLDKARHPCAPAAKARMQAKFHGLSLEGVIARYKASPAIQAELEKTGLTARDAVVGQMAMGLAYKHIKMAKMGMSGDSGKMSDAMKANIALLKAHWSEVEANVKKRLKARRASREKRGGKMPACYKSMMMKMSAHG